MIAPFLSVITYEPFRRVVLSHVKFMISRVFLCTTTCPQHIHVILSFFDAQLRIASAMEVYNNLLKEAMQSNAKEFVEGKVPHTYGQLHDKRKYMRKIKEGGLKVRCFVNKTRM